MVTGARVHRPTIFKNGHSEHFVEHALSLRFSQVWQSGQMFIEGGMTGEDMAHSGDMLAVRQRVA